MTTTEHRRRNDFRMSVVYNLCLVDVAYELVLAAVQ